MDRKQLISLCITSFNRVDLTLRSFVQVASDPRIGEIVIVDDGSEPAIADELKAKLLRFDKVCFFGSSDNQGVYHAKKNAILLSYYEWCILLDSDNVIGPDYLDRLYSLPDWDDQTSYLPAFGKPTFDYRHFAGIRLRKENVGTYLDHKMFDCLINTMNGFYNKTQYMLAWDHTTEPLTSDSMYLNYLLLDQGNTLEVVEGLEYEHTIHAGSHYKLHSHKNVEFREELFNKYKQLH
jgi:glycosyltransferase involved in cell wall biosynthesis